MSKRLIAPSMLSADFLHLAKDVEMVNNSADLFHLDIMDGVFVPNISFGFPVVEAIASKAQKPMDVHLMITDPGKYISRFASVGAAMISFHLEAVEGKNPGCIDGVDAVGKCKTADNHNENAVNETVVDEKSAEVDRMLEEIRSYGCKAGLVINPDIPVERLFPHLTHCDYILIMSVFAGFGGQSFIPDTLDRIRLLKKELTDRGLEIPIEVDGGVSEKNIDALSEAGAEIFVAGSAIFRSECPADYIAELRK